MSRVNFNDAQESTGSSSKFFKLEEGQVARVQFLISEPNDIPTFYAHHIDVDGFEYGKDVQCNMDDYDEGDCVLCKCGIARKTAAILIMYDLDTKEIKLWQRSKKWVSDKIIPLLNRYDLRNTVVEIERQGKKLDTSYSLFAMPEKEPVDTSNLEIPNNFDFMIWKKSNDDMQTYIDTGAFPESNDDNSSSTLGRAEAPVSRREQAVSRRGGRF